MTITFKEFKLQLAANKNNVLVQLDVAEDYLKDSHTIISSQQFLTILGMFKNYYYYGVRGFLAQLYLSNQNTNINPKQFLTILGRLKEFQKKKSVAQFYLSNRNTNINSKQLLTILGAFEDDWEKCELAVSYLSNPNTKNIDPEQFLTILGVFKDDEQKILVAQSYLSAPRTGISSEQFLTILGGFKDDGKKMILAASYLRNPNTKNIDTEQFLTILGGFKDDIQKSVLAQFYLSDRSLSLENITLILQSFSYHFRYDPVEVFGFYRRIGINRPSLWAFAEAIYPNTEAMQIELLQYVTNDDLLGAPAFFARIKDDGLVLQLIEGLLTREVIKEPKQVLELCKGRFSKKYESLRDLFTKNKDLNLEKYLTEQGIKDVASLFGSAAGISILDLLSYYDVNNGLVALQKILLPGILAKIKQDFRPSPNILSVTAAEIMKFSQLTEPAIEDANSQLTESAIEDAKNKFISNEKLCEYFVGKVNITAVKDGDINKFKINFGQPSEDKKEIARQQDLNNKIRIILRAPDAQIAVVDFFQTILPDAVFSEPQKTRLCEAWKRSKDMIATLLAKEGGIDDLISAIVASLPDGCSANVGSQISGAACAALLNQNKADSLLYQVLSEKIIKEVFSSGDLIGSESNPLKNTHVTSRYVSPDALCAEISKKLDSSLATDIIKSLVKEEDKCKKILYSLCSIVKDEDLDKSIKDIAFISC